MFTPSGPIALTRPDGAVATFSIPGQPDRPVALKRRTTSELLSEELRRLDPDDVYAKTLACMVKREKMPEAEKKVDAADRRSAQTSVSNAAARTAGAATAPAKTAAAARKSAAAKNAAAKKAAGRKTAATKTATKKTTAKKAGSKTVARRS
jgi:hypothetical protein